VFYDFDPGNKNQDPADHPGTDGHFAPLVADIDVCNKGAAIENEANTFPTYRYDPTAGRIYTGAKNSNWYVWKLLSDNHLYLGTPPNAPGWP
jgi:hypothetical protein